jgi:hypothetical protein
MPMTDIIVAVFMLALVAGILASTFWAISRLSGWASLAQEFPLQNPLPESDHGIGSLSFAPIWGYNGCVLWRADDDYLHLRIMLPFNLFHPPMSLPWTEVQISPGKWGTDTITIGKRRISVPRRWLKREQRNRELLAGTDVGPDQNL